MPGPFQQLVIRKPAGQGRGADAGVLLCQLPGCHLGFRLADVIRPEKDLAAQIGCVHRVEVRECDAAYAGRREVGGGRTAEAADTDDQHAGIGDARLPGLAHLCERMVARIAMQASAGHDVSRRQ